MSGVDSQSGTVSQDKAEVPMNNPGQTATGEREKSQELVILLFPHSKPPHQQAASSQGTVGEVVVIKRWRIHPVDRRVTWLWYLNSLLLTAGVQVSQNSRAVLNPFNKIRRHQHMC